MNLDNYSNFYKIDPESKNLIETNLIYTPKISPDSSVMCMNFDFNDPYLSDRTFNNPNRQFYNKELVSYFFNREFKYFQKFQGKFYTPNILDIDLNLQRIFFEWGGKSCNHIIFSGESLNDYCSDWKDQLFEIINDIKNSGYCKASLYPHCFYIKNKRMYTFDYYGCAEISNPFVLINDIRGMMGISSIDRFEKATEGDYLNLNTFSKDALKMYVKWPEDALSNIYRRLYK
jgi:hypothetical protein